MGKETNEYLTKTSEQFSGFLKTMLTTEDTDVTDDVLYALEDLLFDISVFLEEANRNY